MKDIKQYINESTQGEDLHEEIGLALKEFGNIRNGFKMVKIDDIKDAMYKAGFDFVEEDSSDEKLVFVGETEKPQYYVNIDDIELTIVFTTLEEIKVDKEMYNTIIVFDSECVYLYNKLENFRLMNYYEYINSNNLDFRLAKVDDRMFWNKAFEVVHQVLNNYEGLIMTSAVLIIVFQTFGLVLIITTLLTLFNRLGMKNIYSFGIHWRLMLYYMAPFVLGSLFATLFNVRVFEYIGLIVTLIYSFKINQISFLNSDKGE